MDILNKIWKANPDRLKHNLDRRVAKLGEEAGELAQAYLDVTSDNRKGKTWNDVREECVDTSIIALDLALTPNPQEIKDGASPEFIRSKINDLFEIKLIRWMKRMGVNPHQGSTLESQENEPPKALYEILVPTIRNSGKPIHLRCHKVWDSKVRKISGGLTIIPPAKGQWVAPDGTEFHERMIPVRVFCTADQIEKISDMTAKHYEQLAVMFYKISDEVKIKHYDSAD